MDNLVAAFKAADSEYTEYNGQAKYSETIEHEKL